MKKGFTLAEIMIVLTVIGILSAVLMPVAFQAAPDKKAMKFKKAHSVMGTIIRELVSSDQYYQDGDLGKKAGGGTPNDTYLCNTMADVVSLKSKTCSAHSLGSLITSTSISTVKSKADEICKGVNKDAGHTGFTTSDDVIWYEGSPMLKFSDSGARTTSGGFINAYKAICFDVDALNSDEDPFGYAVRYDGKIIPGNRADAWTQRSIQRGD